MKLSFILTTSTFIEKNYSEELDRGFKNVTSMIEIETKNEYQYMIQIILRSIYIHLISCYFPFK